MGFMALAGVLGASVPAVAAPRTDPAAALFETNAISQMEFTLSPEGRAALDADPDEYVEAGMHIESIAGDYDDVVGLRLKGHGSFRTLDAKAAFKVKFKEFGGDKFLDLKKLTLNNMVQDQTMLRESLSYEIFRAAGVPAPRVGYSFVRVNGAPYGVYANVETLDDVSLPFWFSTTNHLLEGEFDVDVRSSDLDAFEVDEGDDDDLGDLEALIDAVEGDGASFSDRLAGVADLDEMIAEFAVEKYIGAWDNYTSNEGVQRPNNYYLHSDEAGVFSILPWGNDQSLWNEIEFDGRGGTLFEGCRTDPVCWERFRSALAALPATISSLDPERRVTEIAAMLAPWQDISPLEEVEPAEIASDIEITRAFLRVRPDQLYDQDFWLYGPPLESDGVAPDPDPDRAPPETTITKAPGETVRTKRGRVNTRFKFSSSEPGSTFLCHLEYRPWKPCTSPFDRRLAVGWHTFRVVAFDAEGNADPTPAKHRWRVRRN
jgi:hypothetical protein